MIKIGSDDITNIYLGSDQIQKVYFGSDLVWELGGSGQFELKITAQQDFCTFEIDSVDSPYYQPQLEYSYDGEYYDTFYFDNAYNLDTEGDVLYIRGTNFNFSDPYDGYYRMGGSGQMKIEGNLGSLVDPTSDQDYMIDQYFWRCFLQNSNCNNTTLTLNFKNLTFIGEGALSGLASNENWEGDYYYETTIKNFGDVQSIGINGMNQAFYQSNINFGKFSMPNVGEIQTDGMASCFYQCGGITSFVLGNSSTNFNVNDGFDNCFSNSNIENVYVNYYSLDDYYSEEKPLFKCSFENCYSLSGIYFPNLTSIASHSLDNMLSGYSGNCEIHFASGMENVVSNLNGYANMFGASYPDNISVYCGDNMIHPQAGITFLDYVVSQNTPYNWIDTGINPSSGLCCTTTLSGNASGNAFVGTQLPYDSQDWRFFDYSGSFYFDNGSSRQSEIGWDQTRWADISVWNNGYYVDVDGGSIISGENSPVTLTSNETVKLASHDNSSWSTTLGGKVAFKTVKLYENGTLLMDLRPAMDPNDNDRVGMYDMVSQQMYYPISGEWYGISATPAPTPVGWINNPHLSVGSFPISAKWQSSNPLSVFTWQDYCSGTLSVIDNPGDGSIPWILAFRSNRPGYLYDGLASYSDLSTLSWWQPAYYIEFNNNDYQLYNTPGGGFLPEGN